MSCYSVNFRDGCQCLGAVCDVVTSTEKSHLPLIPGLGRPGLFRLYLFIYLAALGIFAPHCDMQNL